MPRGPFGRVRCASLRACQRRFADFLFVTDRLRDVQHQVIHVELDLSAVPEHDDADPARVRSYARIDVGSVDKKVDKAIEGFISNVDRQQAGGGACSRRLPCLLVPPPQEGSHRRVSLPGTPRCRVACFHMLPC